MDDDIAGMMIPISKIEYIVQKRIKNLEQALFINAHHNIYRYKLGYTTFVELTKNGYAKNINNLAELYLLAGINIENKNKKAEYFYKACFFNKDVKMKKIMPITEFSIQNDEEIAGARVNVKTTFDFELLISDEEFNNYTNSLNLAKEKLRNNEQIIRGIFNAGLYNAEKDKN